MSKSVIEILHVTKTLCAWKDSISVRFVSEDLNTQKDFLDFNNTPDWSLGIPRLFWMFFCRLNISLDSKLCCFSFDSASTLIAKISSMQNNWKTHFRVHILNIVKTLLWTFSSEELNLRLLLLLMYWNLLRNSPFV